MLTNHPALSPDDSARVQEALQMLSYGMQKIGMSTLTLNLRPVTAQNRVLPPLPGILFNTLPKSGSMFIFRALAKGLDAEQRRISGSYFPDDFIVPHLMEVVAAGDAITQEHLPAHRINLVMIQRYLDRMVLHVRDPRQATLSWAHFCGKVKREGRERELKTLTPPLPDGYFDWPFDMQLDWQIDNHLPICIQWIEEWLDADDSPDFSTKILFTRFEDFKADNDAYYWKVIDFLGIDRKRFVLPERAQSKNEGEVNFRKGEIDEWRTAFTEEQAERATAMMSKRQMVRFAWTK
jgi:hypothetical protein